MEMSESRRCIRIAKDAFQKLNRLLTGKFCYKQKIAELQCNINPMLVTARQFLHTWRGDLWQQKCSTEKY